MPLPEHNSHLNTALAARACNLVVISFVICIILITSCSVLPKEEKTWPGADHSMPDWVWEIATSNK